MEVQCNSVVRPSRADGTYTIAGEPSGSASSAPPLSRPTNACQSGNVYLGENATSAKYFLNNL